MSWAIRGCRDVPAADLSRLGAHCGACRGSLGLLARGVRPKKRPPGSDGCPGGRAHHLANSGNFTRRAAAVARGFFRIAFRMHHGFVAPNAQG